MNALKGCRRVPGWEKPFLSALEQGKTENTAMHLVGIGLGQIKAQVEKDPVFKERYEHAKAAGARRGQTPGLSII